MLDFFLPIIYNIVLLHFFFCSETWYNLSRHLNNKPPNPLDQWTMLACAYRPSRWLLSSGSDVKNLPGFTDSIDVQKKKFANKGLNTHDLVTLVEGHTIGTSAYQFFRYRHYNFTTTANGADPSINPAFLPQLQALCPDNSDGSKRVALDTGSGGSFDVSYFTNFRNGRGVLESDQKLWTDASTRTYPQRYSGRVGSLQGLRFNVEFGRAMVKMGNIGVKTGSDGEIRRSCSAFN